MVKFAEAEARWFKNVFVCRKCKHKLKSSGMKIAQGKVKCRNCGRRTLRAIKKK